MRAAAMEKNREDNRAKGVSKAGLAELDRKQKVKE